MGRTACFIVYTPVYTVIVYTVYVFTIYYLKYTCRMSVKGMPVQIFPTVPWIEGTHYCLTILLYSLEYLHL